MTEVTRRLKSYCEPDWEGARYGSIEELISAAANTTEIIGNMWENPELLEVKQ